MCARYAASTTAVVVRRPRPTAADRAHDTLGLTDRPVGRLALPCRRVSHSGAWRGGGAVVVGAGPARSALSTTRRGPHAGAGARAQVSHRARYGRAEPYPRPDANARRSVDRHSYDCCNQQQTFSRRVLSFHYHHLNHTQFLFRYDNIIMYSAAVYLYLPYLLTPHHKTIIFTFLFSSSVTRVNCRFHRYSRADVTITILYYFVFDFFPLFYFFSLILPHPPQQTFKNDRRTRQHALIFRLQTVLRYIVGDDQPTTLVSTYDHEIFYDNIIIYDKSTIFFKFMIRRLFYRYTFFS